MTKTLVLIGENRLWDKIEGGWDDAGSVLVDLLEVTVSPSVGIDGRRYKAFESSCQIKSG